MTQTVICPICKGHPMLIDADKQVYSCVPLGNKCHAEHVLITGALMITKAGVTCMYYNIGGRPATEAEIEQARQYLRFSEKPAIEPLKFAVGRMTSLELDGCTTKEQAERAARHREQRCWAGMNPEPKHPHETDCGMVFDPADPVASAKRMIGASRYSSEFRDSPVIRCLEALIAPADQTCPRCGGAGDAANPPCSECCTKSHPVDVLEQLAKQMFPGHEIDQEAFGRLRAICDEPAEVSDLITEFCMDPNLTHGRANEIRKRLLELKR